MALLACAGLEAAGRAILFDPRVTEPRESRRLLDDPSVPLVEEVGALGERQARRLRWGEPWLRERAWAAQPSATRVVFAGDSTVYEELPEVLAAGLGAGSGAPSPIEVLNFGSPGASSDRVARLVEAAAGQGAAAIVVYVGHNEIAEGRLNPESRQDRGWRAAVSEARHGGIGRLIRAGLALPGLSAGAGSEDPSAMLARGHARGVLTAEGGWEPIPLSEAERAAVSAAWARNLRAMCAAARAGGARLWFVEPVSDLWWEGEIPRDVEGAPDLQRTLNAFAVRSRDPEARLREVRAARRRWPEVVALAVYEAEALLWLGRREEAIAVLSDARERDGAGNRIKTFLKEAMAREAASCGATYLPTEAAILSDPRATAPQTPLFLDAVHPSREGNLLLAAQIASALAPILPPGTIFDPAQVTLPTRAPGADRGFRADPNAPPPGPPGAPPPGAPPPGPPPLISLQRGWAPRSPP